MRRSIFASVVVGAVLLAVGSAGAAGQWGSPGPWKTDISDHPRVKNMRFIAERHFPAAAKYCPVIGIRTPMLSLDPDVFEGETWDGYCEIRLRGDWPDWSRPRLCLVIVHEYGHIALGPAHSDDPNDVMYESPDGHGARPSVVPACGLIEQRERVLQAKEDRAEDLRVDRRWFGRRARGADRAVARRRARAQWHNRDHRLDRVEAKIASLRALLGP